ncbi:CD99 antigen-like protein 2 [Arapaima gigas]
MSPWPLLALFSLLALRALSQDLDLLDAVDKATTEPPPTHTPISEGDEKQPPRLPEGLTSTTKTPEKLKPKLASSDLDLSDALDPSNDMTTTVKNKAGGRQLTDNDLSDIAGHTPDKGKDTVSETATIAGIVSAVTMALVGAVSSYISYQKKKLCFSIQQSLNAEVTKGENPEAVVSQEPQAQQTLLQPSSAEPPQDHAQLTLAVAGKGSKKGPGEDDKHCRATWCSSQRFNSYPNLTSSVSSNAFLAAPSSASKP